VESAPDFDHHAPMSKIAILHVPYDSGHRDYRMGRGPEALISGGLLDRLDAAGHRIATEKLDAPAGPPVEPGVTFGLIRDLAKRVKSRVTRGTFPLVLSGNCIYSAGAVAGLGKPDVGVVWFDAHGDLNTPETTRSGFLDGMALSVLLGRCWRSVMTGVPGFAPVSESRVVLAGARDLDPPERELIESSAITWMPPADVGADGTPGNATLDDLARRAPRIHVHLDLDVLDSAVARINPYQSGEGLDLIQVAGVLRALGERFEIVSATVSAYDPDGDRDGRGSDAALALIDTLIDAARPITH
jgi:arginase